MKKTCTTNNKRSFQVFGKPFNFKKILMLAFLTLAGYLSLNYSSGPALNGQAATGSPFNGMTCNSCHSGGSYAATLTLQLLSSGSPVTSYTAGGSYVLRLTRTANATYNAITNAGFGFQLTCATGTGSTNYNGWGSLPSNVANRNLSSRNYIEHTAKLSKTITQEDIPWTAPSSSAGDAHFYAALNTVNGDGSTTGDQVVSASLTITSGCPTPTVSIAATATTVCSGTSVTFTATPTNGGTSPTYQWQVNGANVSGATNSTYTSATLANANTVKVIMTPTAPCNTSSATSNTITMVVNANMTPSVTASATATTICNGTSVTFTATPTNGGTAPTYQWRKNSVGISNATNATYTATTLSNGDVISVTMTTAATCYTAQTATSTGITMNVNSFVTPAVSLSATATTICAGTAVTFTATPTNGGSTPTYQWKKNTTIISGATDATYSSNSLTNGDIISVTMTTSTACYSTQTATSSGITMVVNSNVTPTVTASTASTTVCPNTSVTFIATNTNGGTAPTYHWYKNGVAISGASNQVYTAPNGVLGGDVFYVSMTSNNTSPCLTAATVNSNSLTMTVAAINGATITASGSTALCPGGSVTLSTSGGSSYLWSNGATTSSINVTTAGNYSVTVQNGGGCSATSNVIKVNAMPSMLKIKTTGLTTVCEPLTVPFSVDPSASNISNFSFQWKNGSTPISGATDSVYIASGAGQGNISLTIFNATCSLSSTGKPYVIKPLPVATFTAGGPTAFCAGSSVTLTAPTISGYSYTWLNNGVSAGNGDSKVMKTSGVYTVVAKLGGCIDTSNNSVTVVVNLIPVAAIAAINPVTFCAGDSCKMVATPTGTNYNYAWVNGSTSVNTNLAQYTTYIGGTFKVTVTDNNGCVSKASASSVKTKVNALPVATITAASSTTISSIGNVKLTATNATGTYQWYKNNTLIAGATAKLYTATTGGIYTVATTKSGCTGISAPITVTQLGPKAAPTIVSNGQFEMLVYPNPATDEVAITINNNNFIGGTIYLMDCLGKLIIEKNIKETSTILNLQTLSDGVYIIRFNDDAGHMGYTMITKR